ncbi:MAG: NADH-quinone oxidoreductase subunit F 2 [Planctomycetaceae bacterium]|nr:MAG: NADH-quinone oxidoreductase subunit F 2 [Planctomycetaceae bacterium]
MSATFEPVLLARVGRPDSHRLATYRADGGYQALQRALEMKPEEVIELVKQSGLRGRGGAGFPTGLKWTFLPKGHPGPIYLAVNADESEPGTFNNRILMEEDPHQILEGIAISCYAIRSNTAYIYLRYEYGKCYRVLEQAIAECREAGILGPRVFGRDFGLEVYLHRGAGAYICGEETGLIESLEGKRAWPRIKPPFPAIEGLFRKPTIVNNIETMACVTQIVRRGADWFKSIGVPPDPNNPRDAGSYGPKLYCLSGHVNRPGCYELPLGVTARELIEVHGGGVPGGRKVKAVVPGGISMGFLSAAELDTPLDFNGPMKAGCLGLGTAAVIVIDDQTSMVDVLYNCCRFFSHESCGQCTPCREGTAWMTKILRRIRAGQGELRDLDLLLEIAGSMGIIPGTTICGLADGAAWPVKNALTKFRAEFEEFIRSGRRLESPADTLMEHPPAMKLSLVPLSLSETVVSGSRG